MISVIVPIYNCEPYLRDAIESVLSQTYKDFELLLIDDGSTDNGASICQEYALKDKRVIFIHQENGGVSKARNTGLDHAKGEWIIFLDADDYFCDNEIFGKCVEAISKDPLSLPVFNFVWSYNDGYKRVNGYIPKDGVSNYPDFVIKMFTDCKTMWGVPWGKLLSKKIIDERHIRFIEGLWHREDALFLLEYCVNLKSITYIDSVGLSYRVRTGSLSHSKSNYSCFEQGKIFTERVFDLAKNYDLEYLKSLETYCVLIFYAFNETANDDKGKTRKANGKQWIKKYAANFSYKVNPDILFYKKAKFIYSVYNHHKFLLPLALDFLRFYAMHIKKGEPVR